MSILRDPSGERLFLEGRLEGLSVPDLIHAICLPRRTGTLTISRAEVSKTIYIKNGQLVFAASNVAEDRLGETLLRDGVIGYTQLETAISYMGAGKRLGSILVELGYLAPDKLVRGLLHQVREIILSVFPWEGGAYRFVEEPLPTAEVITLNIATSKLILDGIRRITSWPRIVRSVGYARATYRLTREGRAIADDLDLGTAEKLILASLERPVSVGEICRSVFLANFDVYQYLWAFRILGIIQQVESDPETNQTKMNEVFDAGESSEADIQEDIEFALIQMKAETLNKINEALGRLEEGLYGNCFECGEEIAEARLRALPFAVRCKDCEEAREVAAERERIWQSRRGGASLFMDMSS